jgi:hypothetical protein
MRRLFWEWLHRKLEAWWCRVYYHKRNVPLSRRDEILTWSFEFVTTADTDKQETWIQPPDMLPYYVSDTTKLKGLERS